MTMMNNKRHPESMISSKGTTRRFYFPDKLYDQLVDEAIHKDVAVSKLLVKKLTLVEKLKELFLNEYGGEEKK